MLKPLLILVVKDINLLSKRGSGVLQALFLGLLIIILFALAGGNVLGGANPAALFANGTVANGVIANGASANAFVHNGCLPAAVFWLACVFFLLLLLPMLYFFEEGTQAKKGLVSMGYPLRLIWLAKTLTGFVFLLAAQLVFLGAIYLFLGQAPVNYSLPGLGVLLLANSALVCLASLLCPVAQIKTGSQMLLALLFIPICLPLLLRLVGMGRYIFKSLPMSMSMPMPLNLPVETSQAEQLNLPNQINGGQQILPAGLPEIWNWPGDLLFVLAFAFIFVALAVLLFPLLYRDN